MRKVLLVLVISSAVFTLSAGIVFTREAPGVQQTTVAGALTETFDAQPLGPVTGFASVNGGTYSAGGVIVSGDQFGGAYQTPYNALGAQSGAITYDISFSDLKTYFGMYWPAGDALNQLDFYDGAALKGSFRVGDIAAGLPAAYFGNPNIGGNTSEPYVYLNFTSQGLSDRFNRVVFLNDSTGTGFESDNHSTYDQIIDPPGVPEPSTWAMMVSALGALGLYSRRRKA